MTQLLMLDAAYPPPPGDLIADMTTVGAHGAFLYVWGPYVNGSPAHVQALQQAGMYVAPIIVPGNLGGDPPTMLGTVKAWGFNSGPVFFDFEQYSEPSDAWWILARDTFRNGGFHADRYGTISELGQYDPGDADWIASWIRTGILEPIPTLPSGWRAWQFVNDININGHEYDASVVDASLFGAATISPYRGGNMGPFVHPSIPNRRDYLYVAPDLSVVHAWWDGQQGYTENLGGYAVPGFVGGAWINDTILALTHVSGHDGQLYEMGRPIDGSQSDWYPIYGEASLPIPKPGPQGLPGQPGPPGKDGVPQPGTYPVEGTFTIHPQ